MNVALLLFTCIVIASCSFGDSYLVGKTRDPYWAHRPYGRSNNNPRPTPSYRRYSSNYNYNNNNNNRKLGNSFSNNIDDHLTELKLKKFFHGHDGKYGYPSFNNKNSFKWGSQAVDIMNKVKMPKMPPMPSMPTNTGMNMREWPEYIPPITMIKLPLDEPPAAIN